MSYTYEGSKAFAFTPDNARGTKTFVEGIMLSEVRKIVYTPGKHTVVTMNWIPEDEGQNFLIDLFLNQEVVGLEVNLPWERGIIAVKTRIADLNIELPKNDVASMYVTFAHVDRADDGPEVRAILLENAVQECDKAEEQYEAEMAVGARNLLHDLCAHEAAYDQSAFDALANSHTYHYTPNSVTEPAGGGFQVVHEMSQRRREFLKHITE